jgi:hypothetical protein
VDQIATALEQLATGGKALDPRLLRMTPRGLTRPKGYLSCHLGRRRSWPGSSKGRARGRCHSL